MIRIFIMLLILPPSSRAKGVFTPLSSALTKTVPALAVKQRALSETLSTSVEKVAAKIKKPRVLPRVLSLRLPNSFYYGIPQDCLPPPGVLADSKKRRSITPEYQLMGDALEELKFLRSEMETLRRDLTYLKKQLGQDVFQNESSDELPPGQSFFAQRKRQREFDLVGLEVEQWAEKLLFEESHSDSNGWREIVCNSLMRSKLNPQNTIKCYLKWMKDSRGRHADPKDQKEYPCIKMFATLEAPLEDVCDYLSDETNLPEYNDLVVKHKDLEEITPHSKICWARCPQILFIKPREFVTFCHHRWLQDGTQVVINQAVEHPDVPASNAESDEKECRAYALRGANFISRHPDDPNKTVFSLICHANPGGGIPQWACRTAVNAVAPIEPFKLFHKINENVKRATPQLHRTETVGVVPPGRSGKPGGLSQLGYACFWPKGGGLKEGFIHQGHPDSTGPDATSEQSYVEESDTSETNTEG